MGTIHNTVLEFWYTEGVSGCDSDSGFDSSPDFHDGSDYGLCCWYSTIEELVLEAVVIVYFAPVESDTVVGTKTVVETGMMRHMGMDNMVEAP